MKTLFVLDDDEMFHRIIELSVAKAKPFKDIYHYYEVKLLIDYLWENRNDASNLPDVIFVDINIPVIDGWGFLDAFDGIHKALCKTITIYIITVSISSSDKIKAAYYPFVKEFIVKPIYLEKLKDIAKVTIAESGPDSHSK